MNKTIRRILVTGACGFIGKNLVVRLREQPEYTVSTFVRGNDPTLLTTFVESVDAIVHLAGENRPTNGADFERVNVGLTSELCCAIQRRYNSTGVYTPIIFSSSTQADLENPYGKSKLAAEKELQSLARNTGNPSIVCRLPGVFGKWSKPNYNSVVATFCHNIARSLPIQINSPTASVRLVYIDDVVTSFIDALENARDGYTQLSVKPEYTISLSQLKEIILNFHINRKSLTVDRVGVGLERALYATYLSFLPKGEMSYEVPQYADSRGVFVEMLKTHDSGQISYFTAKPGITRGGHYHHTKSEKFIVIRGSALFRFRNLVTNESVEISISGEDHRIVDSIPGWIHNVTNVGNEDLIVMLWANESFNREKPDTVMSQI